MELDKRQKRAKLLWNISIIYFGVIFLTVFILLNVFKNKPPFWVSWLSMFLLGSFMILWGSIMHAFKEECSTLIEANEVFTAGLVKNEGGEQTPSKLRATGIFLQILGAIVIIAGVFSMSVVLLKRPM
jgi:predicted neutral ceramidase superfamily lipid hydrolase